MQLDISHYLVKQYYSKKIKRNLLEAVREIEQDEYRLRIFPEYLEIGTLLPAEESHETDELFDDEPEEKFAGALVCDPSLNDYVGISIFGKPSKWIFRNVVDFDMNSIEICRV